MTKVRSYKYIPCRSWSLAVTSASVSESGTLERPCFFPSIYIPRAIFSSDSLPLVLRLRSFQDKSRGTGRRSLIDADYPLPIPAGEYYSSTASLRQLTTTMLCIARHCISNILLELELSRLEADGQLYR